MQRLKLERNKLFSIATTPTPQRKKENVAISLIAARKKKKKCIGLKTSVAKRRLLSGKDTREVRTFMDTG